MGKLRVDVLGRPAVTHGGLPVDLHAKAIALLSFLAVTGERHSRTELAGMLWGDLPDHRARANLRMVLLDLRKTLGRHLDVSAREIGPGTGWLVDLADLPELLASGDGRAAERLRSLAGTELLAGLAVAGAPGFDEWLGNERRRVDRAITEGMGACARAMAAHDPERALSIARDLLALDPLDEAAHRLVMKLLDTTGRRAAALAQYETCRLILADELGVDPSPQTVVLRDRLLRADSQRDAGTSAVSIPSDADPAARTRTAVPLTRRDLPGWDAPLIGRADETARVKSLLTDGACRLLTLVGPGGVGKTRLAVAVASELSASFDDGVVFVALGALPGGSPTMTVAAELARAIDVAPWKDSPLDALRRAFIGRDVLVVLDNVEHLDLHELLTGLLDTAPGLTVLATSRQRVGLGHEWLFDLEGLGFPKSVEDGLADAPAVILFTNTARRVRTDFTIDDDPEAVLRICRLVGGLPLALELAAQWTHSLDTREVARLIGSDLDTLATDHGIVVDRQRSMRSVLEATWRLLDRSQDRTLARLSVFHGGFTVDAARAVTGASAADLGRLVDRCVVQRRPRARFDLHELLRQFAAERLNEDPSDAETARRRHAEYFASIATVQAPALAADLANLRAATRWLIAHGDEDRLADCLDGLWYADKQSERSTETLGLLDAALARPEVSADHAATWHRWAGTAAFRLGRMDLTVSEIEAAFAALGQPVPRRRPALLWAIAREAARQATHRMTRVRPHRSRSGDATVIIEMTTLFVNATYNLQQPLPVAFYSLRGVNAADRCHDPGVASVAYAALGHMISTCGWHRLARTYGELADMHAARADDSDMAYLGLETRALSHIATADWTAIDELAGRVIPALTAANATHRLLAWDTLTGVSALYRGRFPVAFEVFDRGLSQARAIGDEFAINWCMNGLTDAALGIGGDLAAVEPLQTEAVARSRQLAAPEVLKSAVVLAALRLAQGREDAALTLLRAAHVAAADVRFYPAWAMEAYSHLAQVWLALWEIAGEPRPEFVDGARQACRHLDRFARAHPVATPRSL
jgi:predicted ATPase/DNA-binding SARP family transcriptional activator